LYIGSSKRLAESTRHGAHGAITASANYAFTRVDEAAAQNPEAQAALTEVTSIVQQFGVPGTKYAATLAGMDEGRSRLPLLPLNTGEKRSIQDAYHRMLGPSPD
jgi:dihydrodipicolinate synthase/N-acetylneuraminate lyase